VTPQSSFMVVARIRPDHYDDLLRLLASMKAKPGQADRDNALVPLGKFERLHFAPFVIPDDLTTADIAVHNVLVVDDRPTLVFFGDCDGDGARFVGGLAQSAGDGLRQSSAAVKDSPIATRSVLHRCGPLQQRDQDAYRKRRSHGSAFNLAQPQSEPIEGIPRPHVRHDDPITS
jgi:hypothetical protein